MDSYRKNLTRCQGHFLRRLIHLSMGIIPFLYYWFGKEIVSFLHINMEYLISLIIILIAIVEITRLLRKQLIFGQRAYETKKISAVAWTFFSVGIVLLFAPKMGMHGAALGVPLIWSLCVGDPVMGEVRIMGFPFYVSIIAGATSITIVWLLSAYFLTTPWWIIPVIVPITVLAELCNFSWIDDNATMLLLPLAILIFTFKETF